VEPPAAWVLMTQASCFAIAHNPEWLQIGVWAGRLDQCA
jgi:hypothetical protein